MTDQEKQVTESVERCHKQIDLSPHIRKYLNDRLITDEMISDFKLGYGKFYGNTWITIPIPHPAGHYSAIKLRRDPRLTNDEKNKFKMYPMGHSVTVFGLPFLFDENMSPTQDLDFVINEGECDSILLNSYGVPAITTTGGAGTFREEWIDLLQYCRRIFICYDLDKPGQDGASKVAKMILSKFPKKEVFNVNLPEELGKGGDVTDYFKKFGPDIDTLIYSLSERVKRPAIKMSDYQDVIKPDGSSADGGNISKSDIDRAAATDCEKFVKVERRSYETAWAHCPFGCKDSNPSFCCYKGDRGSYSYCCGFGGNAIDLVRKLHNMGFKEAVNFINSKQ